MARIDDFRRRKPKVCPFCKANVSTPYKGIHEETEEINGMPVQCRNNGKLNSHIAYGYLKTKDDDGLPKEGIKYFVEHPETRLWFDGWNWTNDPNRARSMEFEWVADRYARMKKIEKYIITEHQFFNEPTNEQKQAAKEFIEQRLGRKI